MQIVVDPLRSPVRIVIDEGSVGRDGRGIVNRNPVEPVIGVELEPLLKTPVIEQPRLVKQQVFGLGPGQVVSCRHINPHQ